MPKTRTRISFAPRALAGLRACGARLARRCTRLHRDESGTVSVISIVALLFFTVLLGQLVNVAKHVDDKLRMQNASDAAAYSGGVVLARGMNAVAFSNHLLCDVFALTAFMREGRDRHAEQLVPEILEAWKKIGPIFENADFAKFKRLGNAITAKAPLEQRAVTTYSQLLFASSQQALPVLEYILGVPDQQETHLIPEFQRAVVRTIPNLSQMVSGEMSRRHGLAPANDQTDRGNLSYVMWRTRQLPVGLPDENDPNTRTLPAIDPDPQQSDYASVSGDRTYYLTTSIQQRQQLSFDYLNQWNADRLRFFAQEGKMSQFYGLWQIFTCGQLQQLLNVEYPATNLPFVIRSSQDGQTSNDIRRSGDFAAMRNYLDTDFRFVGIAYRKPTKEFFPGVFKNPMQGDTQAFSEIALFVPLRRWVFRPAGSSNEQGDIGGGGFGVNTPIPIGSGGSWPDDWVTDGSPTNWDLLNQNWSIQLVPATTESVSQLLALQPPTQLVPTFNPPNYGSLPARELRRINTH